MTRLQCSKCREETIHDRYAKCIHCKTVYNVGAYSIDGYFNGKIAKMVKQDSLNARAKNKRCQDRMRDEMGRLLKVKP